jgi:hypothetical protein
MSAAEPLPLAPAVNGAPVAEARSPYIVGPRFDWAFFLLPPVASLALAAVLAGTAFAEHRFWIAGKRATGASLMLGVLVHAHLVAVVARSHLNGEVFRRHRVRFVVVPVVAFAAMMSSLWAVVIATVLVVFWDVYHSALQTFGLGRIYDRNAGNDPRLGRRLDLGLNLLLYVGPIVGGAAMLPHFEKFEAFEDVDAAFFTRIPAFMAGHQRPFVWAILVGGALFVTYYVIAYARLRARGYRISRQKVFLLASTGLCSIYAWGFNPWGQAFFIMNVFHAVQYLALVGWWENGTIRRRLRLDRAQLGRPIATALFLAAVLTYGYWAELVRNDDRLRWSIVQVVSLMHFFYDGFIWSVQNREV